MRIISGKFKGRIFKPPSNLPVRPTTDFAKTGLFNLLENRLDFENLQALDLFSGFGNVGVEILSRGGRKVYSVDKNKECVAFQKEISVKWEIKGLELVCEDVFSFLKRNAHLSFSFIFADPPYDLQEVNLLPGMIFDYNWLEPEGWLVIEHDGRHDWRSHSAYSFTRNYGKVHFSFFHHN